MMTRPLHVLIDGRMLLGRFSGVARMVTRLVESLAAMDDLRVGVLCGNELFTPWANRFEIEVYTTDFSRHDRTPVRRLIWEETRLRRWIRHIAPDIYHATWNQGVPGRCPVPSVLTIHDLIPWDEPASKLGGMVNKWSYRLAVRRSALRASAVVAVSEFSRGCVQEKLRLGSSVVSVVRNGVDDSIRRGRGDARSQPPYVLYVGGHEDRKNLETAFRAMAVYWSQFDPSVEFRLTGRPESLTPRAAQAFREIGHPNLVRFLGSPNDIELADQYSNAAAVLLLSRAEGFGLPALEAMAHGVPVIAARAGALPEVVGQAGLLVDPGDAIGAANALRSVMANADFSARLTLAGAERAKVFTWRRAAEAYSTLYQSVLAQADELQTHTPNLSDAAGFPAP